MTTLLPRIELESAPNPNAAVIWLHGLGADGNDFASLVPELVRHGWICPPARPSVLCFRTRPAFRSPSTAAT